MNNTDKILLDFIKECGGIKFIQRIAGSSSNPFGDQKVVAVAKAAYCKYEATEK